MITPNCFKGLCTISHTEEGRKVRKYFIEIEKLTRKYYENIRENTYKEIELLKKIKIKN